MLFKFKKNELIICNSWLRVGYLANRLIKILNNDFKLLCQWLQCCECASCGQGPWALLLIRWHRLEWREQTSHNTSSFFSVPVGLANIENWVNIFTGASLTYTVTQNLNSTMQYRFRVRSISEYLKQSPYSKVSTFYAASLPQQI